MSLYKKSAMKSSIPKYKHESNIN